jgi:hypothetical protein
MIFSDEPTAACLAICDTSAHALALTIGRPVDR